MIQRGCCVCRPWERDKCWFIILTYCYCMKGVYVVLFLDAFTSLSMFFLYNQAAVSQWGKTHNCMLYFPLSPVQSELWKYPQLSWLLASFSFFLLLKITQKVLNSEEAPFSVSKQLERGARHQQAKTCGGIFEKKRGKNLAQVGDQWSRNTQSIIRLSSKTENTTVNKHRK